jgi:hypothetical protein
MIAISPRATGAGEVGLAIEARSPDLGMTAPTSPSEARLTAAGTSRSGATSLFPQAGLRAQLRPPAMSMWTWSDVDATFIASSPCFAMNDLPSPAWPILAGPMEYNL